MKCKEVEVLVDALLDNELAGSEETLVEEHFKECESCLKFKNDHASVRDLLSESLWMFEKPSGLNQQILDAVAKEPVAISWFSRTRPWLFPAVASLAAVASLVLFVNSTFYSTSGAPGELERSAIVGQISERAPLNTTKAPMVQVWNSSGSARPRLVDAQTGRAGNRRVVERTFALGHKTVTVRRIHGASPAIEGANKAVVDGRQLWVTQLRDGRNVVSTSNFDGEVWVFLSFDFSRSQLVKMIAKANIDG